MFLLIANRMNTNTKIVHPLFLFSLLILILNDWYFKYTFHNEITGKLSDFAGLFVFPFLFSILLPKHKKIIHIATVFLFIFWKSQYSEFLLMTFQNYGIPFERVVDWTDLMALVSVFFSYKVFGKPFEFQVNYTIRNTIIFMSFFACLASNVSPKSDNMRLTKYSVKEDNTYEFDMSKRELVSILNHIQLLEIEIHQKGGNVSYNASKNIFHLQGQNDTLALMLDYRKVKDKDVFDLKNLAAEIKITGNNKESKITLISAYKNVSVWEKDKFKKKAKVDFEKKIVAKIKDYKSK